MTDEQRLIDLEARVARLEAKAQLREPLITQFSEPIPPGSSVRITKDQYNDLIEGSRALPIDRPLIERSNFKAAHRALHLLWTKAAGAEGYDKREWVALENAILKLANDGPGDPP